MFSVRLNFKVRVRVKFSGKRYVLGLGSWLDLGVKFRIRFNFRVMVMFGFRVEISVR